MFKNNTTFRHCERNEVKRGNPIPLVILNGTQWSEESHQENKFPFSIFQPNFQFLLSILLSIFHITNFFINN